MPVIIDEARFLESLYLKRLPTTNGAITTHGTSIKGLPVSLCCLFHAYVALLCQDGARLLALDVGIRMTNADHYQQLYLPVVKGALLNAQAIH